MSRLSRRRFTLTAGAALVGLANAGCGYALAGRGSFLPQDIKTVGIPLIENHTTFYRTENILTEKVRAEFIGRGKYRILPDANGADAILTAELLSVAIHLHRHDARAVHRCSEQ